MKRTMFFSLLAIALTFSFTSCDDGSGKKKDVTEAYVTVTGLSSKYGKYLSVDVYKLGEGNLNPRTPLLITRNKVYVDSTSKRVHVLYNYGGSFDPYGTYDVEINFYDNVNDTSSYDYYLTKNVLFTSGVATIYFW